jgi:hypothetical protein
MPIPSPLTRLHLPRQVEAGILVAPKILRYPYSSTASRTAAEISADGERM